MEREGRRAGAVQQRRAEDTPAGADSADRRLRAHAVTGEPAGAPAMALAAAAAAAVPIFLLRETIFRYACVLFNAFHVNSA